MTLKRLKENNEIIRGRKNHPRKDLLNLKPYVSSNRAYKEKMMNRNFMSITQVTH